VPEVLQKMIEEFAIPRHCMCFLEKYGRQRAQYDGLGFVSDWHPLIPSTTWYRHIWVAFSTTSASRGSSDAVPETILDMEIVKRLEGHMVLITYRNKDGHITKMNPKRIVCAAKNLLHVDHGPDTTAKGFTLSYRGVISIELFVEVPR